MTKKGRKAKKLKKKKVKVKRPIRKWAKKVKTKKWVPIHAPKIFNEVIIGETITSDPKKVIGKTVELKLSILLRDMSKSHIQIKLVIDSIKDDGVYTQIVKYSLSRIMLSRIIRRRTSKVESVDDVTTQDGKRIRIKSFAITLKKATSLQKTSVRNKLSKLIRKTASEYNFEAFVLGAVSDKIQSDINKKLKKVYPLRKVEIRMINIVPEKKTTGEHRLLKEEEAT
jgi:small subunit ribosomal protein S3Ae